MKIDAKAQNLMETMALKAGLAPVPLAHGITTFLLSRALLDANELGVFQAIGEGEKTLDQIATATQLNPNGLRALLGVLASAGYMDYKGTQYSLTPLARKWLLPNGPKSVVNQLLLGQIMWDWMTNLKDYLRTGKGVDYHDTFTGPEWDVYQKAMLDIARLSAGEVAKKTPLPQNAQRMLDIGGSHGLYSVEICKRHPGLSSTILDLPGGVEKAAPLLARYSMGERVKHQAGNVLTDDLGDGVFDLVFISSLMHHFTAEENQEVVKKAARALKPGGYFVIQEFIRPQTRKNSDTIGSTLDLFFAVSSASGTWAIQEFQNWQTKAGLKPMKPKKFLTMPGYSQVAAVKS